MSGLYPFSKGDQPDRSGGITGIGDHVCQQDSGGTVRFVSSSFPSGNCRLVDTKHSRKAALSKLQLLRSSLIVSAEGVLAGQFVA